MKRLIEATIGPLLDSRARRALDETLLDWSHEAALAQSVPSRLVCHSRAMLAIARTVASIVANEIAELPTNRVWLRIACWLLLTFPLQSFAAGSFVAGQAINANPDRQLMLAFLLLPSFLVMSVPFAFFLGAVHQPRPAGARTPFLGVAVVSFVLVLCLAGWIMPAANQAFRQTVFEATGGTRQLVRGAAELTLPELISASAQWGERSVLGQLNIRLCLVLAGPVLVMLAAQLQRVPRWSRWLTAIGLICASGFLIEAATRLSVLERSLAFWLLPALAFALTIVLGLVATTRSADASA